MTLTLDPPPLVHSLDQDCWPEHTTVSATDVTIAGVSLLRLVDWCDTPCVHNAAAVVPNTGGDVSESELASIVVARIVSVELLDTGELQLAVDARLDRCNGIMSECRLIGRSSRFERFEMRLVGQDPQPLSYRTGMLPADIRAGDLVAIPCTGTSVLHDIRA